MEASYSNGDLVLVKKISYWFSGPKQGDVVVLRDLGNKDFLLKRVIGLGGDRIQIKRGLVRLNGKELKSTYGHGRISIQELTVPKGYVWVIGDNMAESWYGICAIKSIVGKVN